MPVVLVEVGGVARSGHLYADLSGSEYEFPSGRYERWIRSGERFVYQSPGSGYTGVGIIGDLRPSNRPGRIVCHILSPEFFDTPVPLKRPDKSYYEADPAYWKRNVYWGQGVRPLTSNVYEEILGRASGESQIEGAAYPDGSAIREVEDYSVEIAAQLMAERFALPVTVMPHSNPGFDIRVGEERSIERFVEVKGTRASKPGFWMSEGERQFASANSSRYTLVVVAWIDLAKRTHASTFVWDGELVRPGIVMNVAQWRGEIQG